MRIWSIPCSTGEEPYSIAMWLLENWAEVDAHDIEIVGSDIDTNVLEAARAGVFGKRALMRLTPALTDKYFTLADPEHKDSITPDFWIQSEPITNGDIAERYILIDPAGAVFFLRLDKAIRIYMQFSPDKSADAIERNREAMTQGFRWLSAMLTIKSIAEVIFDSQVQALRAFCGRRLGFKQKKNTLTKRLAVYTPASSTDEAPPAVTV